MNDPAPRSAPPPSRLTRALAAVCGACPFCRRARARPDSGFARALRRVERFCPFCRARDRLVSASGRAGD